MNEYLDFAKKIAFTAGEILEKHRHSFVIQKTKDELQMDIATTADYAAESHLVDAIHTAYPMHGIMAEESGVSIPNADYVWVIDPLDGTKEYIRNSPYYYTLLSLENNGMPVCAVGYQPAIKRMFFGSISSGAYVDTKKIRASHESSLAKSFINIVVPNNRMSRSENGTYLHAVQDLIYTTYRLRNTPWDVEALFNVAMGAVEGYVMPPSVSHFPKWWDISSGLQIVLMAGGKITDFYGNPILLRDVSKGIVASNGHIHAALLDLLRKHYPLIPSH